MTTDILDAEALAYLRDWLLTRGHRLARLIAERADVERGRAVVLVAEGTPLLDRAGRSTLDFSQWQHGSPVPLENGAPLRLGGRIRWHHTGEIISGPEGNRWIFREPPCFPSEVWLALVERWLALDLAHVALFEESHNTSGNSTTPDAAATAVTHAGEVYQLLTPGATAVDIEGSWHAALKWSSDHAVGVLTSVPKLAVSPGGELSEATLLALAERAEVVARTAFDGGGFVLWIFGEGPLPEWIDA